MKKGFTLVELLAVIIILAVLAVITTPVVLNFIDKAEENKVISSSRFYIEAVDLALSLRELDDNEVKEGIYTILDNGNICLEYKDNTCKDILMVDAKGDMPISGNISIINMKVSNSNLKYDEDIVVINGELNPKRCLLTYDKDKDEIADIGDMITCSTESFHVISNDGTTISMLAQYNLDVGYIYDNDTGNYKAIKNPTGLQKQNAQALILFSTTDYWYDYENHTYVTTTKYPFDGSEHPFVYGNYADSSGNQQNIIYNYLKTYEENLIERGVLSTKVTLISYDELEDLGCSGTNSTCHSSQYDWIYSETYWTGSANFNGLIWAVQEQGKAFYGMDYCDNDAGVRPVVNISVNELK